MKGNGVCLCGWVLEGGGKKEMWLHFYGSILVFVVWDGPVGSTVDKTPGYTPSLDVVLLQQDANQHISSPDVSQRFLEAAHPGK